MDKEEEEKLLNFLIEKCGVHFNMETAIEELAGLITAISIIKKETDSEIRIPVLADSNYYARSYWKLCGEVASVKIMIKILEKMLCQEAIDLSYARKLNKISVIKE